MNHNSTLTRPSAPLRLALMEEGGRRVLIHEPHVMHLRILAEVGAFGPWFLGWCRRKKRDIEPGRESHGLQPR